MTQTLNDMDRSLEIILDLRASDDDLDLAKAEKLYSDLLPFLEQKIDNYVGFILKLENRKNFRLQEAKRITALAKQDESLINWLKEKLLNFMQRRVEQLGDKGKKLEGKLCKISLANNGGKQPIWINDRISIDCLPEKYIQTQTIVDTNLLKEDALANGEIKDDRGQLIAKVMPKGKHLRIS